MIGVLIHKTHSYQAFTPHSLVSIGRGALLLLLVAIGKAETVRHVDESAMGSGDGSSWTNAFPDLQTALAAASAGDEIWVADGIYKPDVGTGQSAGNRSATFQLVSGVELYGGFPPGGGDGTFGARNTNPGTSGTVLSGDLSGDDGPGFSNTTENSYHVVSGVGADATALLDGFVITGANADGASGTFNSRGGGITCFASSASVAASPTIVRCRIAANQADQGSGIYVRNSAPSIGECQFIDNASRSLGALSASSAIAGYSISDCWFSGNTTSQTGGSGGAINNHQSSPTITGCHVEDCHADFGGAIYNSSGASPIVTGCSFKDCSASTFGGAVYNSSSTPTATFTDCDFISNKAKSGGASYLASGTASFTGGSFTNNSAADAGNGNGGAIRAGTGVTLTISDCVLVGNQADSSGGGIYAYGAGTTLDLAGGRFMANSAAWGGGVYAGGAAMVSLRNGLFRGNRTTQYHGGAVYLSSGAAALVNCAFSGNSAQSGGALGNYRSDLQAVNCSFQGNHASTAGGAIYSRVLVPTTYTNCIVWENGAAGSTPPREASLSIVDVAPTFSHSLVDHFSDVELNSAGSNNLDGTVPSSSPGFLHAVDALLAPQNSGDLRLHHGSPCLDLGDNSANSEPTDLGGNSRIQGGTIDLGAYEGSYPITFATLFPGLDPEGDSNANGVSDFTDYASGGDPLIRDTLPAISMDGFHPVVRQRIAAEDFEVIYQMSTGLGGWTVMTEGIDYIILESESNGSQRSSVLDPTTDPQVTPRMFYRAVFSPTPTP